MMQNKVIITNSPEETMKFAKAFSKSLSEGDVIALIGELGCGKTTYVQGLAEGLDIEENVNSPTFKIINEFYGRLPLYHFDFYRLDEANELLKVGFEHYIYGDGITVVEWADRFPELLPEETIIISFTRDNKNPDYRKIEIQQRSEILA